MQLKIKTILILKQIKIIFIKKLIERKIQINMFQSLRVSSKLVQSKNKIKNKLDRIIQQIIQPVFNKINQQIPTNILN